MDNYKSDVTIHADFLDFLFANKSKASSIFRDILGIHEIDHFSITLVDSKRQLLCLSSTPALEFNLFKSELWHFDQSYHPAWFKKEQSNSWQSLYDPLRYDELYYVKQV